MQIKSQILAQQIQKKIDPLYVLIGQDNYLLEESLNILKTSIKNKHTCDEKIIYIQSNEDWKLLSDEANSYSLFSEAVLIHIHYDKKTLDASGKKILQEYLTSINPRCYLIIRAPNIPAKQLSWLANHQQAVLVTAYPLDDKALKQWIISQLKKNAINFESQVPDLIHHYTQGNMLACAQVIEKIVLSYTADTCVTSLQAREHLSDQCNYSTFELIDACLQGQADKAIHILRQSANNKTEPTLVLWMLSQEIRTLLQLLFLSQQKIDFNSICSQLKIWPQRSRLYQQNLKKHNNIRLQQLLSYSQSIDEMIKSNTPTSQIWNAFEKIALSLSIGTGELCIV